MLDMLMGTALSGAGQIGGQMMANSANKDVAQMNNEFNASEAQKNRDYQTSMSNTMHQREVEDLKKAGLNPILSANTGASSPGGATASSSGNPSMQNPFANLDIGGSIRDAAQLELQTKQTQADMRVKDAQAAATISNSKLDPTRKALMLENVTKSQYDRNPNTMGQLGTKYLSRMLNGVETGVRKQGQMMRNKTNQLLKQMSPEDWNKLQNSMEGKRLP